MSARFTNAPYGYLTKPPGENEYYLFILIPVKTGFVVTFSGTPDFQPGKTVINIQIDADINADSPYAVRMYRIDPSANPDTTFNPDTDELIMEVYDSTANGQAGSPVNSLKLLYKNTDREPAGAQEVSDEIAYNCPYLFLGRAQVNGGSSGLRTVYRPSVLLSTRDYRFEGEAARVTSPDSGGCETILVLSPLTGHQQDFLTIGFQIDEEEYFEDGRIEGAFSALSLLEDSLESAQEFLNMNSFEQHKVLAGISQSGAEAMLEKEIAPADGLITETKEKKKKKALTGNM